MIIETGSRIYNNDYADLLIEYNENTKMFEQFENATVQIIDSFLAVVHIPITQITQRTILEYGYISIPTLNGLVSEESINASGITRIQQIPGLNLRGKGVLIGIIDTGIDYTNPVFIREDNTTKIAALWDQTIYGDDFATNTYYGTEYTMDQINQALQSENPYELVPSSDEIGHGTMMAGIIVGNDVPEQGFFGIVPDAELVVVKLKPAKPNLKEFWRIPQDAICYQDNDILKALEYLEQTSIRLNRPMSICLGLGTTLSPHDGWLALARNLTLRAQVLNIGITVAAGNEGNARGHYYNVISSPQGQDKVELNVGANEQGFSMVLWGDSPGIYALDITTPSGEYITKYIPLLDDTQQISFIFEPTIIIIDYQMVESQSGDQLILLRFSNPTAGIWKFNVYGRGDLPLGFHIWLPMRNFISENTYFLRPDPNTTIISTGNSAVPITITAYDPRDNSLYLNASRGYTRLGNVKPDLAAPGVRIMSPTINNEFVEVTGSSPAAAHTAGVVAMILEWGSIQGNLPFLNTEDIKVLLIRGARRDPTQSYPNREWGYGILDLYNVFDSMRNQ